MATATKDPVKRKCTDLLKSIRNPLIIGCGKEKVLSSRNFKPHARAKGGFRGLCNTCFQKNELTIAQYKLDNVANIEKQNKIYNKKYSKKTKAKKKPPVSNAETNATNKALVKFINKYKKEHKLSFNEMAIKLNIPSGAALRNSVGQHNRVPTKYWDNVKQLMTLNKETVPETETEKPKVKTKAKTNASKKAKAPKADKKEKSETKTTETAADRIAKNNNETNEKIILMAEKAEHRTAIYKLTIIKQQLYKALAKAEKLALKHIKLMAEKEILDNDIKHLRKMLNLIKGE